MVWRVLYVGGDWSCAGRGGGGGCGVRIWGCQLLSYSITCVVHS